MKNGKLTDQELETLAKTVFVASRNAGEIETLVSDPGLYNKVLAKIASEYEAQPKPSRFKLRPVAAFASVAILISVSFVIYFGSRSKVPRVNKTTIPDTINDIKPVPYEPAVKKTGPSPEEPAFVKTILKRPVVTETAQRRAKRPPAKDTEPVFHPIGFAERAADAALDGRVVRVEMPRSALFALGVDLPLENGTRSVKADLLVGADGSPRAIRLVE